MNHISWGSRNSEKIEDIIDLDKLCWWDMDCKHDQFLCSKNEIEKGEMCALCFHEKGKGWIDDEMNLVLKQKGFKLIGKLPKNSSEKFNYTCVCGTEDCKLDFGHFYGGKNGSCKKCRYERVIRTNLKRTGYRYSLQNPETREKIEKTNINKYGYPTPFQVPECKEKSKKTNLEKLGCEYPTQNKDVMNKIQKTNLDRYGNICSAQNPEIKKQIEKTNLDRYGFTNPLQNQEIKDKIKTTNIDKYGYPIASQSDEVKEKIKATNLDRYGYPTPFQVPECKEKSKQTCLEKYGKEYSNQSEEVKEKIKATNLDRYGFPNAMQNEDVKEKIRQTNLDRYGFPSAMQNPEIFEKAQKAMYSTKNYVFPSGREIKIQGYEDKALNKLIMEGYGETDIKTSLNDKEVPIFNYGDAKRYFPDIYIPSENKIIEVKSTYTFGFKTRNFEEFTPDKIILDIYVTNLDKMESCLLEGYNFEFWIYNDKDDLIIVNEL